MLLRSQDNLLPGIKTFLSQENEVVVYSAFLKTDVLSMLYEYGNIKTVVVRWQIQDIVLGSSDLESLFEFCSVNDIQLYRNTRLHVKALWNRSSKLFLGSSNFTKMGMGLVPNSNLELGVISPYLDTMDRLFLSRMLAASQLVNEDVMERLKDIVKEVRHSETEWPSDDGSTEPMDEFRIDRLPMSANPEFLSRSYFEPDGLTETQLSCLAHDIELYGLDDQLDEAGLLRTLKVKFNDHPFILAFKREIKEHDADHRNIEKRSSMRFGAVRRWFADNTTTVPTPRPFELNDYVNTLYDWIVHFDEDYSWSRPSHTQVIRYRPQ